MQSKPRDGTPAVLSLHGPPQIHAAGNAPSGGSTAWYGTTASRRTVPGSLCQVNSNRHVGAPAQRRKYGCGCRGDPRSQPRNSRRSESWSGATTAPQTTRPPATPPSRPARTWQPPTTPPQSICPAETRAATATRPRPSNSAPTAPPHPRTPDSEAATSSVNSQRTKRRSIGRHPITTRPRCASAWTAGPPVHLLSGSPRANPRAQRPAPRCPRPPGPPRSTSPRETGGTTSSAGGRVGAWRS
jgi:hypothetical protein